MSYSNYRRRQHRASSLAFAPGQIAKLLEHLRQPAVLLRLGLCTVAGLVMWLVTAAWVPPFSYRTGFVPPRDIIARVDFSTDDEEKTRELKDLARSSSECIYINDPQPLQERRQELTNLVSQIVLADSLEKVQKSLWEKLVEPGAGPSDPVEDAKRFTALKAFFSEGMSADKFNAATANALASFERNGLLDELKHKPKHGSRTALQVRQGASGPSQRVEVNEVLIPDLGLRFKQRLTEQLKGEGGDNENAVVVAELAFNWLYPKRLPTTLKWDENSSELEAKKAADAVPLQKRDYHQGLDELAAGGKSLGEKEVLLLHEEYAAWRQKLKIPALLNHSFATFGMYFALYILCGFYIYHRRPTLLTDLRKFSTLLAAVALTVGACWFASADQWRIEIVPLLLFGMTAAIAYEKELALLLSASVSLIVAFSLEQGLAEFVILVSSVAAAVLLFRRIRSRTKLIYVGAFTGLVVVFTTIGVGTLSGQAFGASNLVMAFAGGKANVADIGPSFMTTLLAGAGWFGFCSLLAGLLMTGLLPFIERIFDVQTDISLLELADVQHPLLQELVRRAPGTYNHSINVASIAETAADSIGANGLLVRVGAYFHDVGKMLKPSYFVENQGSEGNKHDSLQPAMSTLVIIAHVKDGADLARQYHLPQSLIDFVEQHHGTTLVEYFYRREAKRLEAQPDSGEVDESTFRYPGPKPQTKEAGVLMISDVVESASRALVDPTPARIESLVHDLSMKRLLDGQFDECGLTLQELRTIEDSLVKSLTAVYHGRVKYPEHQTV